MRDEKAADHERNIQENLKDSIAQGGKALEKVRLGATTEIITEADLLLQS